MKKLLISISIFIFIFNYIFCNFSYATEPVEDSADASASSEKSKEQEAYELAENDGNVQAPGGMTQSVNGPATQSTLASIIGSLASLFISIPMLGTRMIDFITEKGQFINYHMDLADPDNELTEEDFKYFTIEKAVFGNYYLLNANVFRNSENLGVTDKNGNSITPSSYGDNDTVKVLDDLRGEISKWYYILRLIALALGILTLIYIGIRMAISTVAEEQAKYKKMLVAWVQSILIIAVLPYVMTLINYAADLLMNIINSLRTSLQNAGQIGFEKNIMETILIKLEESGGMDMAAYCIAYIVLFVAQFKFFMMYIRRFFTIAFLTVISPLITITYSIDKAGDGKAQAFSAWFEEYLVNILIQPLQAILYIIFVFSANTIATKSPVIGVIFLLTLTKAEKIFKTIFNIKELTTLRTMSLFNKKK